ncbi:heavy metal translocating P-type ATPase [Cohnella massiliensis]|uniref:heavy metal translocating P-type ATPase n=1 Tax=Cohnella massiliensis TaxID=1816691 RepID=UPI0009BC65E5|nr:cation-translocating P-type ATPase [Cohnella massiliensis]
MATTRLYITGMTCAACSTRIEKALRRMDGIEQVSVNLALAQALIQYEPKQTKLKAIYGRIEQLGYGAIDGRAHPAARSRAEVRSYLRRFALSAALSVPLLWAMLGHIAGEGGVWVPPLFQSPVFQWIVATALLFGVGYPFYNGAYQALKGRSANMDVLVSLSASAAYFYSHYQLFRYPLAEAGRHAGHLPVYFDTIAMILTFLLLGKLLEAVAKGRALKDLNALYDLQVRLVRLADTDEEQWVPAETLRKGTKVSVRTGEWIPADGIVVSGRADVDESLLTGESATVVKNAGDRVYSGTRNANGDLTVEAVSGTDGSRLSRMIDLVEEAQNSKPLIARKVDRVAAYFVPAMLVCAALTFFAWIALPAPGNVSHALALQHALAVLIIACPCALGLSTPLSILVGSGIAAKSGILFKEGRALETLQHVDHVLLDKTGTLTEGKPTLAAVRSAPGKEMHLLRTAAAVEQASAHPLAQAVVQAAFRNRLVVPPAERVAETVAGGVAGIVEGKKVCVGSYGWLKSQGVRMSGYADAVPRNGTTVLYVAADGRLEGALELADRLRPEASEAVRLLRRSADVWMVTGDQEQTARYIADRAGIDRLFAGVQPERKLELVRSLQREGRTVAMIGDGMNDAAALAAADIGIAMGGGTDAAMQAGDVVLLRNKLTGIARAIAISRRTIRNIRQNLMLAVVYNLAAVPIAAFGFMDPRMACIGMSASSLLVVGNALRLHRFKEGGRRRDAHVG